MQKKSEPTTSDYIEKIIHAKKPIREFHLSPAKLQGQIFLELPKNFQEQIGQKLHTRDIQLIFKYLTPDKITDFLQNLPEEKHEHVTKKLDANIKEEVNYLLNFDPTTAAGLMSFNYITITPNTTLETIQKKLKNCLKPGKKSPTILIKTKTNILKGELPYSSLLLNRPENISDNLEKIPFVYYNETSTEIIKVAQKHRNSNIVVVNYEKQILGIIESSQIIKLIEQQKTNQVYGLAGVNREEDILDSALTKFKSRYKWLILNLFTAFLAAGIVSLFETTLSKLVLLAVYMPIIAGMGGNAATQTLAVVVRGIATHKIDTKHKIKIILNEMSAGILNGIICGTLVAITAGIWNGMWLLGIVVGISMIINLLISGIFGTILPFILEKLKIDPAVAATVFVTTATDVVGFFVFLGLAELFLI